MSSLRLSELFFKRNYISIPFGRIVIDEMREISDRLDKRNTILYKMNAKLDKLDILDGISSKLDTLPEKIAEALKR